MSLQLINNECMFIVSLHQQSHFTDALMGSISYIATVGKRAFPVCGAKLWNELSPCTVTLGLHGAASMKVSRLVSYIPPGALKTRDGKTRNWKTRHQIAGVENAGPENGGTSKLWKAVAVKNVQHS